MRIALNRVFSRFHNIPELCVIFSITLPIVVSRTAIGNKFRCISKHFFRLLKENSESISIYTRKNNIKKGIYYVIMEKLLDKLNQMAETKGEFNWENWSLEERKRLLDIYSIISKKETQIFALHHCALKMRNQNHLPHS